MNFLASSKVNGESDANSVNGPNFVASFCISDSRDFVGQDARDCGGTVNCADAIFVGQPVLNRAQFFLAGSLATEPLPGFDDKIALAHLSIMRRSNVGV